MPEKPLNLLLVEDDEDDYIIILEHLMALPDERFHVEWVSSYPEAVVEILNNHHDLLFFDYRLGMDNGIDLIREVRGRGCVTPIVMLTRYSDRFIEVKARQAGAADFLLKRELSPENLARVIQTALRRPAEPAGQQATG